MVLDHGEIAFTGTPHNSSPSVATALTRVIAPKRRGQSLHVRQPPFSLLNQLRLAILVP